METYIILLRGVMPTGKNKVPMAELRVALEKAGLKNVQTYIQSGNAIVKSSMKSSEMEKLIHQVIKKDIGADIAVVAKTATQFGKIAENNPFVGEDTKKIYFTLLAQKPESKIMKDFASSDYSPEKVSVVGDVVYTFYATKYRDSKFNNNFIERKLGVSATTRNFNTMTKLVELAQHRIER